MTKRRLTDNELRDMTRNFVSAHAEMYIEDDEFAGPEFLTEDQLHDMARSFLSEADDEQGMTSLPAHSVHAGNPGGVSSRGVDLNEKQQNRLLMAGDYLRFVRTGEYPTEEIAQSGTSIEWLEFVMKVIGGVVRDLKQGAK